MALEKLHEMQRPNVDKNTTMFTDSSFERQTRVSSDSLSANGMPSVAQYIRRVFLISDNDIEKRLLIQQFFGAEHIFWEKKILC